MTWRLFLVVLVVVLLVACNSPGPAPPSQPADLSPTGTSGPTLTTLPTKIETPAPTTTPQPPPPSPTPTATPQPPPPSPTPTATPQPATPTQPPEPPTATPALPLAAPTVALEAAFTGFRSPVYITHDGEGSRLFVVEKAGRIQMIENGAVQPAPFLDITDRVGSRGSEQGLLSVAFPSDYAAGGLFYVDYTDLNGDTVVARYRRSADNPRQADPASEQKILQIDQPAANHNGGQLQFGPDGYLYIGMGDGGGAGDQWGNAQATGVLLGKILRIDVGETDTYTIPADNPLAGTAEARPEIWALGLRNPWRFSFDRVTGDLYIADVGQSTYEEVDFQPAHSSGGQNYGWNRMEGAHCYKPPDGCDSSGTVLPVAEYDHAQGCSITGGYVYRGTRFPQMAGIYFFADFCSGKVWGLWRDTSGAWRMDFLLDSGLSPSSFGEDAAGELYLVGYQDGTIYHLTAAP
jgi:glucose/arabinose dehydrogenase